VYADPGQPRELNSLPSLEDLLEAGHVLGLNFPVAANPALARGLWVMLKLAFQRAVLQRIPKMAAQGDRVWRDLLFVVDEYHAFATVGETDPTGDTSSRGVSSSQTCDGLRAWPEISHSSNFNSLFIGTRPATSYADERQEGEVEICQFPR
jgi:hypothetical protein